MEQEGLDISRVVSLIMENPALIEQISNLAKQKPSTVESETQKEEKIAREEEIEAASIPIQREQATYGQESAGRNDRARLLGALKPYVSKERAKAIDSMISIADILDMMKPR